MGWSGKTNQSSHSSCASLTENIARTNFTLDQSEAPAGDQCCTFLSVYVKALPLNSACLAFSFYNQFGWRRFAILMTLACCIELVNSSHPLSLNFLDGLLSGSAIIAGDCGRATNNPQQGWHPSLPLRLWREECIQLTMACQRKSPCPRALKGDISRKWWHTASRSERSELQWTSSYSTVQD